MVCSAFQVSDLIQLRLLNRYASDRLHFVMATNVLPVILVDVNPVRAAAAFKVDGYVGTDLRLDTGQDRHKPQLQTGFQQRGLVLLVDVGRFVEVVRQSNAPGLIAVRRPKSSLRAL